MVKLAVVLLAPLLAAAPASAPQSRAKPRFKYFTQLGDEVLNQVDAVLFGKVESIAPLRGADVVRVSIGTWYLGERKADQTEVTLLASPGDFFAGTEQLLFLKLYEGGPRYRLHNRIARSDPDFDAKRRTLEEHVALRRLEREEDRRRQVRKLLYDEAGAREKWARWHAFHELEYVRTRYPDLVTREDRDELTRLAARSADEPFKKALLKLLKDWTP
jgi:hypothetical protein